MGRRSKDELIKSNYYQWLEDTTQLRKEKKEGRKLTKEEKVLLKSIPSVDNPYKRGGAVEPPKTSPKKVFKKKVDFDKNVIWPVRGAGASAHFLCAVFNLPKNDNDCLLFCEVEDCPFWQVGYLRAHGTKF
jgi:hypothetical protein